MTAIIPAKIKSAWTRSPRFWTILLASCGTLFCLALGLFSYVFNDSMYRETSALSTSWLPSIDSLAKIRTELNEGRRAEAFIVFGGTCAPLTCMQEAHNRRKAVFALEDNYGKFLVSSAEEGVLFKAYLRQRSVYYELEDALLETSNVSDEMRKSFLSESAATYTDLLRSITALGDFNLAGAGKAQKIISSDYARNRSILIYLVSALFLVLAVLIGRVMLILTGPDQNES